MIIIDRIIRYIKQDIMLPKRCYSQNKMKLKEECKCEIFCRKNSGGKKIKIYINN